MLYPQERHQNKQNPREITPDEATHSKITILLRCSARFAPNDPGTSRPYGRNSLQQKRKNPANQRLTGFTSGERGFIEMRTEDYL